MNIFAVVEHAYPINYLLPFQIFWRRIFIQALIYSLAIEIEVSMQVDAQHETNHNAGARRLEGALFKKGWAWEGLTYRRNLIYRGSGRSFFL